MRRRLVELLACPLCRRPLELASEDAGDWIEKGHLDCSGCGHSYPIERGVPRLVPISELTEVGDEMASVSGKVTPPAPASEKEFFSVMQLDYKAWKGKFALCAARDSGNDALRAVELGGEAVALARGGEIFVLGELSRSKPKLHPVQCDFTRPPFREGVFDLLLLRGGLEDPDERYHTFKSLARLVRRDGRACLSFCPRTGDYDGFCRVFGDEGRSLWPMARLRGIWRSALWLLPEFILPLSARLLACAGALPLFKYLGFSERESFAERLDDNIEQLEIGTITCLDPAEAAVWLHDAGFSLEKASLSPMFLGARLLARKL
jgi:uncharacterized protein YbaR (Trm112 family)